jgi:hypothetical protein
MDETQICDEFSKIIDNLDIPNLSTNTTPETPKPKKNQKPRCHQCKIMINIVEQLMSKCKCEKQFCTRHRSIETHNCIMTNELVSKQRKDLENSLIKLENRKVSQI